MNRMNRSRNQGLGQAWLFGLALLAPVAAAFAQSSNFCASLGYAAGRSRGDGYSLLPHQGAGCEAHRS